MKYLKKFNEDKRIRSYYPNSVPEVGELDELKDFCETYLAYLKDDGFNINVVDDRFDKCFRVEVVKGSVYKGFYWNEVEDYIIPFLIYLNKNYHICFESIYFYPSVNRVVGGRISYDIDKVISGEEDFSNLKEKWDERDSVWEVRISKLLINIEYRVNIETENPS